MNLDATHPDRPTSPAAGRRPPRDHNLIAVLEGRHPLSPTPTLHMVVQGDLTAVLSATPRPRKRQAHSLHRHMAEAASHQALQTACMALAPLVPVRLDTRLTPDRAARMLTVNHDFLHRVLDRHAGMAQVQVTVLWQAPVTDPRQGMADQLAQRLNGMITAEVARVAVDTVPLNLTPELVWSGVVLLRLQDMAELGRALARITALWPDGLLVRRVGPHPVNAFATLDLIRITRRQVDQALAGFGLTSLAEADELPAIAHRRLLAAEGDGPLQAVITEQAEVLAAAARACDLRDGFDLCRIWTDGRLRPAVSNRAALNRTTPSRAVA